MVVVKVFGQSIPDIFIFDVVLVALLDSVGTRLAGLPVVDRLDVVGLALRTDGGVVGSTAGVTAAREPGVTETAAVLFEDTACQVHLHQESLEGDAALLDDPAVHLQSAQLLRQDLLELLGQDGVWSGREKPNSVGHTDFSVSYSGIFYLPLFQQNSRMKIFLLSETNFVCPLSWSIYVWGVSCKISGV